MQVPPFVRAVVVNFNGGEMTTRCLDSLTGLDWPADRLEIVLVDNASTDSSVDLVAERHPGVRIVRNATNAGFGGGCNAAIGDLDGVDFVALLNNDAVVERHWLARLVSALVADRGLGGASGKVVFAPSFTEVEIESPTFLPGRGDRRRLGVRVSGLQVDGLDRWDDALFRSGFWGAEQGEVPETSFRWTQGSARLLVPGCPPGPGRPRPFSCRLRLASASERPVTVRSGPEQALARVGTAPTWVDLALAGPWYDVVNSVGGAFLVGGYGADRGFLETDDGRFGAAEEVFSWTGTAALLSADYLRDVGLFDDRFFLYYEDLDLAWRGRLRGWRYTFVPDAVARHLHSASSGRASPLLLHHMERNRLLALTRNAPARLLAKALARFLLVTAEAGLTEAVNSVRVGNGLAHNVLSQRARVLGGYLRLLPATVTRRRADRPRIVVDRADLVRRWAVRR